MNAFIESRSAFPKRRALLDSIKALPLTPRQVQRAALRYLLTLGTPAKAPKVTGKGKGRPKGYRPVPRTRYPLVKKAKTGQNEAVARP